MDDPLPAVPDSRYPEYSVHHFCPKAETLFRGQLLSYTLYFDIYRNGLLCRKHLECYSNSFWSLVRDIFNTTIRGIQEEKVN
jgi:hypothetical protein